MGQACGNASGPKINVVVRYPQKLTFDIMETIAVTTAINMCMKGGGGGAS